MVGCFGNSPYDRYMESQLKQYLKQCDEGEKMDNLMEDMMYQATHDAALFRTYDDDFEVVDRDQIMRCLANLDDAVKSLSSIAHLPHGFQYIDAIFSALTIMQKNLQKAVEHKAEKVISSQGEMAVYGGDE